MDAMQTAATISRSIKSIVSPVPICSNRIGVVTTTVMPSNASDVVTTGMAGVMSSEGWRSQ